jgi:predicted regulator of Ras-like GTPase activity (Roadblock/LC7/MglB family)
MSLQEIIDDMLKDVDAAVGAAVVDVDSGLMLAAAHNVPYFTQTYLDAVAAAAVEMIRGRNIRAVEELLTAQRGEETINTIEEVQMTTAGTYHFMSTGKTKKNILTVLITTRRANLGMGWAALRGRLAKIEEAAP